MTRCACLSHPSPIHRISCMAVHSCILWGSECSNCIPITRLQWSSSLKRVPSETCFLALIVVSFSVASSKLFAKPKFNVRGFAQRFTHRFTASGLLHCYPEGPRGGSVSTWISQGTRIVLAATTTIRNFTLYAIFHPFNVYNTIQYNTIQYLARHPYIE